MRNVDYVYYVGIQCMNVCYATILSIDSAIVHRGCFKFARSELSIRSGLSVNAFTEILINQRYANDAGNWVVV